MAHPTIPVGPQKGNPPSLEWVGIDRLTVDPAYQRATDGPASRRIIVGMVKAWDWALCQPLVVSRRADGTLWILDGQHRHAGAQERGDIPHLPCVVLGAIAIEEEASTFVALNEQRQRLSQADIFFAMLAAGDHDAKAVYGIMGETGWQIIRHRATAAYGPGELYCAPMLVRQLQALGPDAVRFGLTVLRTAWPETAVRPGASLLKALFHLFANLLETTDSAAAITAALATERPESWILRGEIRRERQPTLSSNIALAMEIAAAARGAIPAAPSLSPAPVLKTGSVARPVELTDPLGQSSKSWCDQCDQLVTSARAAACHSPHCKLSATAAAA